MRGLMPGLQETTVHPWSLNHRAFIVPLCPNLGKSFLGNQRLLCGVRYGSCAHSHLSSTGPLGERERCEWY